MAEQNSILHMAVSHIKNLLRRPTRNTGSVGNLSWLEKETDQSFVKTFMEFNKKEVSFELDGKFKDDSKFIERKNKLIQTDDLGSN
jgi:hypothetical protein